MNIITKHACTCCHWLSQAANLVKNMRMNKTLTYLDISYNLIGTQVLNRCSAKNPMRGGGWAWLLHRRAMISRGRDNALP